MNARLLLVALSTTACCAFAQDPAPAATPATAPAATPAAAADAPPATPPPVKRSLLKYTPPKDTVAGKRLDGDGGSRGEKKYKLPTWLYTLTPTSGKGLTMSPQPSLFTYQSDSVPLEYRVTISEPSNPKPLFIYAASSSAAGIHRVDLSQFNITLKPGVDYQWNVALRPDPKSRSADLIAKGSIKRIEPSAELTAKLKAAASPDYAAIYAEAGLWYDALAAISDQIAANPQDKDLVNLRDGLLQQVELKQAVSGR